MRRSRTKQLTDSIVGQHIALSVAAGLARTQLVADPLRPYDAQHLTEMLDIIARALARVAQLYVRDTPDTEPRPLSSAEHEGAAIRRGATIVVLADGRSFSSVTMRRGDLRQAIAILKAVGIPELSPARPPEPAKAPAPDVHAEMLASLGEIDRLLKPPSLPAQTDSASRLTLAIARKAPQGQIANLAMQLMSCLIDARSAEEMPESCQAVLARLRVAIEEGASARANPS